MLTKETLKFRIRSGRVYPDRLDVDAPELNDFAKQMLGIVDVSMGSTLADLEQGWRESGLGHHTLFLPMRKLILDKIKTEEADPCFADRRWKILQASEALRRELICEHFSQFRQHLADEFSKQGEGIDDDIYGDLPHLRPITKGPDYQPRALLHRYNVAQVQGVLLEAVNLNLQLDAPDPLELRFLLRGLKFLRLLADFSRDNNGALTITIDGPLGILQQKSAYGQRFARILPYILRMSGFSLTARALIKKKEVELRLSSKDGLQSHIRRPLGYIPEQFRRLAEELIDETGIEKVQFGDRLLRIGGQSLLCPDLTLTTVQGAEIFVEIFHRWHRGQLLERLRMMINCGFSPQLLIAVDSSVLKDPEVAALITERGKDWPNLMTFRDYPAKSKLSGAVAKLAEQGRNCAKVTVMQNPLVAEIVTNGP